MVVASPAGFWIRAVAASVDSALFVAVQVSYGALVPLATGIAVEDAWTIAPILWLSTILFAALYSVTLHALTGQTLGKMLVGVRVEGLDGEPPSAGVAALRQLAYTASLATFGFGYLMAGLRADKRALHDLLADTRVVRVGWGRAGGFEPAPPLRPRAGRVAPPLA